MRTFEQFLEAKMPVHHFEQHQHGYWGSSPTGKTKKVRAATKEEAERILHQQGHQHKRLRNGDSTSYRYTHTE